MRLTGLIALLLCAACLPAAVAAPGAVQLDDVSAAAYQAGRTQQAAQTQAARSLLRLRDTASPMPPRGYPRPSDAEIAAFSTCFPTALPFRSTRCAAAPAA